jgi:ABC-type Fe3+/spermidine/putrescine transport system ATPase subunit
MIVVTHDPDEAMSLADTILLLRQGRILQSGPTKELYDQPVSPEAMSFLGRVTEFRGRFVRKAGQEITCEVPEGKIRVQLPAHREWTGVSPGDEVRLLVRPDRIRLFPQSCRPTLEAARGDEVALINARIADVMEKGSFVEVCLRLSDGGFLVAVVDGDAVNEPFSRDTELVAAIPTAAIRCFPIK